MNYRGHEISEDIIWFNKAVAYTEFKGNPCYLKLKDLQNIINEYEKLHTKLDESGIKYRNLKIELDAAERYCSDDYPQYNSEGYVGINFTWQELESDEKREKRIAAEKAKIDKEIEIADSVTRKLNEWASKGYNLKEYFIQIVCYGTPAIHNYTIFYDSKLDE